MRTNPRLFLAMLLAVLGPAAGAADFAGGNVGAIPDNNATGRTVSFSVSGFVQPIRTVSLNLGLTHTFSGDLEATLISPGGTARLAVLGRPGLRSGNSFGSGTDLAGSYEFADDGNDLWAALSSGPTLPQARYRSSTAGVAATFHGGCTTSFAGAFGGLAPADVNGTWTLVIADRVGGDTGSIASATLTVEPGGDALYADGFDPIARGSCTLAWLDLTGTGRTSYVVVRNTGGGGSGAVTWFVRSNDGTVTGALSSFVHGIASDYFFSGDWDGDGIDDATIWRPGATGQFIIRPSSRPSRLLTIAHGITGDDPTQVGDYDGDGRADATVFRPGAASGNPSVTRILPSRGGAERILTTGENGSFAGGGIDYTGDGIADMAIQANAGSGVASFRIFDGRNGAQVSNFNFGAPTDYVVVGNHSGAYPADITTSRAVSGQIEWTTRDSGGTGLPTVTFGASATDFRLTGDYDGDGIDDYGIWRPSATAGASTFSIRPSSNTATTINLPAGANGDYPVANTRVH